MLAWTGSVLQRSDANAAIGDSIGRWRGENYSWRSRKVGARQGGVKMGSHWFASLSTENSRPRALSRVADVQTRTAVMLCVCCLVFVCGFVDGAASKTESSEVLKGVVRVVDGDTIVLATTKDKMEQRVRIRLAGIDAPEMKQSCVDEHGTEYLCGERSKEHLVRFIHERPVTCEEQGVDRYKRIVAECFVEDRKEGGAGRARSINHEMVRSGHAVAYRTYSRAYDDDEAAAKSAKRGIWRGSFETPSVFRSNARNAHHHQNDL